MADRRFEELETPRLMIRELRNDDLDFVAEMLGDPEVMRFWPAPYTRDEAAEWIRRHRARYQDDGFGYWLVMHRESGVPLGQIGLLRQEFDGQTQVGLGYMLHRPFWGQGFACEGARRCLEFGFRELGLREVAVLIRPENVASVRVAERLEAVRESETDYAGFRHAVYWIRRQSGRYG
jgi:[ribosomal protein S5]-alanine N-acetyltransferase